MENLDIKRKELAIKEAHRQGFCSSQCPENELDDDLGWGFLTGVEWADEHPKEGLVSIDKACEYLESAIKPYIGYGAACDFVDTFRKIMEKQSYGE